MKNENYKDIMNRKIASTQQHYKKQYSSEITWGESALNHYSKKFEQEKYAKDKHTFKNLKLVLNYNEKTGKLYIES